MPTYLPVALELWYPKRQNAEAARAFDRTVRSVITELDASVQHHVQVKAIVALLNEYASRPELFDKLTDFTDEVVSAALFYRVNSLASALQHTQEILAESYANRARHPSLFAAAIQTQEEIVRHVEQQLNDAREAAFAFRNARNAQ